MQDLLIIEVILRNRTAFFTEIRDGVKIRAKARAMLLSCLLFLALYGLVMGASHSVLQTISSFFKLPALFLLTLFICAPSLHFFNILFGSQQTLSQTLALILAAITTTSVLLFSLAPVTLFFLLTGSQYEFFKLLNVAIFAIAGAMGVAFLRVGMRIVTEKPPANSATDEDKQDDQAAEQPASDNNVSARRTILALWALLYGFVGSQMAYTLSPFIGDPDVSFILFRHAESNFYVDVINSIGTLLGF